MIKRNVPACFKVEMLNVSRRAVVILVFLEPAVIIYRIISITDELYLIYKLKMRKHFLPRMMLGRI